MCSMPNPSAHCLPLVRRASQAFAENAYSNACCLQCRCCRCSCDTGSEQCPISDIACSSCRMRETACPLGGTWHFDQEELYKRCARHRKCDRNGGSDASVQI